MLGYALAWIALTRFGADLGAGYFSGTTVPMQHDPLAIVLFFALGVLASLAGCFLPAWKAATSDPAPALKSSRSADADESSRPLWPGLLLVAAAMPLSLLQPIDDLPLGGYAAVGALLAGARGSDRRSRSSCCADPVRPRRRAAGGSPAASRQKLAIEVGISATS